MISPCIGKCRLATPDEICLGCGRTLAEIAGWSGLAPPVRAAIMRRLAERPTVESRG